MLISVDISDELAAKVDALVSKATPPDWPFKTKIVPAPDHMTASERATWNNYNKELALYEAARDKNPRNRSQVIRQILSEYFANGKK